MAPAIARGSDNMRNIARYGEDAVCQGRGAGSGLAQPKNDMPSPLQHPGLDDPPLREWVRDAENGVSLGYASAHDPRISSFTAPETYSPDNSKTDEEVEEERPDRDETRTPISIELVRGADGVDTNVDDWTVLIDGVRCSPVDRPNETFEATRPIYHLPSPFAGSYVPGGGRSAVRPVVFGVRIEAEALRPSKVELVIEQVVESADSVKEPNSAQASQWIGEHGRYGLEESRELSVETVPMYTPLDHTASCIATAYPFRAPAQSALGLLHLKEASSQQNSFLTGVVTASFEKVTDVMLQEKRWREDFEFQRYATAANAAMDLANTVPKKLASDRKRAELESEIDSLQARRDRWQARVEVVDVETRETLPAGTELTWDDDDKLRRSKQELQTEKNKKYNTRIHSYIPESPVVNGTHISKNVSGLLHEWSKSPESAFCTILGGREKSAIEDLEVQFNHLRIAMEVVRMKAEDNEEGKKELHKELDEMRVWLYRTGEMKAARLLEVLALTEPLQFASRMRDPKDERKDSDYSFLLDRLLFTELRKSSARLRFRLRVTEDGSTSVNNEWVFEASADHGFCAHTEYSEAAVSLQRLKGSMNSFFAAYDQTKARDEKDPKVPPSFRPALRSMLNILTESPTIFAPFAKFFLERWRLDALYRDKYTYLGTQVTTSLIKSLASNRNVDLLSAGLRAALPAPIGVMSGIALKLVTDVLKAMGQFYEKTLPARQAVERGRQFNWMFSDNIAIQALQLFSTKGFPKLLSSYFKSAADFALGKEELAFFQEKDVNSSASMETILSELYVALDQSLPASQMYSAAGKRGQRLVVDAVEELVQRGTPAYKKLLDDRKNQALSVAAERRMRQALYCRMPHVTVPKAVLASRFYNAEDTNYKDIDMQRMALPRSPTWFELIMSPGSFLIAPLLAKAESGILKRLYEDAVKEKAPVTNWMFFPLNGKKVTPGLIEVGAAAYVASAVNQAVNSQGSNTWTAIAMSFLTSQVTQMATFANKSFLQLMPGGWIDQRAADNGLKTATAFAKFARAEQRRRAQAGEKNIELLTKCMRNARGNPIETAVLNARITLKTLRAAMDTQSGSFVLNGNGSRFRFFERFHMQQVEFGEFRNSLFLPPSEDAWNRMQDGLALRFVPPPSLVERVREGEELRRTPLNVAIQRVAETLAAPRGQSGADLARLTAQRIHTEIQLAVRDAWLFPTAHGLGVDATTQRHFTTRSAPRTCTMLSEEACKLLRIAFAGKVPALVNLDDPLFVCFAGGAAARMALRHMPVVEATLAKVRSAALAQEDASTEYNQQRSFFDASLIEWTRERKSIVETVCKAWEATASSASSMLVAQLDLSVAGREALGSFGRVAALAQPGDIAPLLAVASAASVLHPIVSNSRMHPRRDEALRALAFASREVEDFGYQNKAPFTEARHRARRGQAQDKMAFAARRLDLHAMRNAPVGDGVDALIDALGPATVLHSTDVTEHYYVPGGDNLDFQPSPLMYSGVVAQPVWLDRVEEACVRLRGILVPQEGTPRTDILQGEAVVRRREKTESGLARHPLVVTRRGVGAGEVIGVELLPQREPALALAGVEKDAASSLLRALGVLCNTDTPEEEETATFASEVAKAVVARGRVFAFNADRCAAGLTLSASAPKVEIEVLDKQPSIAEAAVAVAMAATVPEQLSLRVPDVATAREVLNALHDMCTKAQEKGCRAVTLAELSVAVVNVESLF